MSTLLFAIEANSLQESVAGKQEAFTVYKLSCQATGEFISIIPQFGGILHQLVLRKDKQLLSLLKTPPSTKHHPSATASLLNRKRQRL